MLWRHGGDRSDAFAVSTSDKKKSRVKCLSCGYSGDLSDLLLDIQFGLRKNPDLRSKFQLALAAQFVSLEFSEMELTAADIPDWETPPVKVEVPFPEVWLNTFKPIFMFADAVKHCNGRGITNETLLALDVRYDAQQQRVCFPFRNFKGQLMGLQGRYIGSGPVKDQFHPDATLRYYHYGYKPLGAKKPHRNLHCWMGEDRIDLDQPLVTCEGPYDYATIYQAYPNVAASFTSGLSKAKVIRLGDCDEMFTFYDHGMGGDAARGYLKKFLPKIPMTHVVPSKEEDDASKMGTKLVAQRLKDAGLPL